MKKSILPILLIAILMVLISDSCSQRKATCPINDSSAYSALETNLKMVSESYSIYSSQTKGNWWRWLLVGLGDAGGFFLSGGITNPATGVTGGVAVSNLIWSLLKPTKTKEAGCEDNSIYQNFNEPFNTEQYGDAYLNYGFYHNQVISELYEKYGESLFDLAVTDLMPEIEEVTARVMGCDIFNTRLNDSFNISDIQTVANNFISSSSSNEFVSRLSKLYPGKNQELHLLGVVAEGFERLDDPQIMSNYTKDVCEVINASNIAIEEKIELQETVSVMNASCHLWNTNCLQ